MCDNFEEEKNILKKEYLKKEQQKKKAEYNNLYDNQKDQLKKYEKCCKKRGAKMAKKWDLLTIF